MVALYTGFQTGQIQKSPFRITTSKDIKAYQPEGFAMSIVAALNRHVGRANTILNDIIERTAAGENVVIAGRHQIPGIFRPVAQYVRDLLS